MFVETEYLASSFIFSSWMHIVNILELHSYFLTVFLGKGKIKWLKTIKNNIWQPEYAKAFRLVQAKVLVSWRS